MAISPLKPIHTETLLDPVGYSLPLSQPLNPIDLDATLSLSAILCLGFILQGGKNRRRGKNENDDEKRELVFKEDGQGECEERGTASGFGLVRVLLEYRASSSYPSTRHCGESRGGKDIDTRKDGLGVGGTRETDVG